MTETSRTLTGGQIIVEMLKRFDVDMMFGLPGDQTDIYDALYHTPEIRHILVRHEQAAAHMADAYARATGKVGVCDASIGPGATNLVSGIAEAFLSGIPVLAIASDARSEWSGRQVFQEVDQVGVFQPITKWSLRLDHIERIPEIMRRAFQIATTGRPGPVFLSFPIDILKASCAVDERSLAIDTRYSRWPATRSTPPMSEIEPLVDALVEAKRPIILAGGGAVASGAMEEVAELAKVLDIPVATTFMGKGIIAENDPMSLGPFGLIGRPATNEYVLNADVALALGTRFTNVDTMAWRIPSEKTRILQIDIEPSQIGRIMPVDSGLTGDVKTVLREILRDLKSRNIEASSTVQRILVTAITEEWREASGIESCSAKADASSPVHPLQVVRALRMAMAPDDTLICDSGFNQIWGGQYFEVHEAGRTYVGPRGFGVMGFSMPAAIATSLAKPEHRTVALCGDGGFAMVIQELETAVRVQAPITVCVMNNSNLQFIKDNQRLLFDSRFISTDFSDLDYAEIARAFGCTGIRVENSDDLIAAKAEAFETEGPTVIDIRIDPDITPERISLQKLPE